MASLPTLFAEPIFNIGSLPITNSYINSTLTMVGFVIFAFVINRSIRYFYPRSLAPKGLLNFFESITETLFGYFDSVTQSRAKTIKFFPLIGTLFFFILVSNWVGLLPGIGSIGMWQMHHGVIQLIPMFRPATTDLNMTLAMAVLVVVSSHFIGIAAIGFFKYANKFIKLGDIWHALKSMNPTKILTAAIEFFVGILEIISEVAKMLSLSLRLFGNIFAGEVLLTVMASLLAVFLPLPFMALEILVGLIQAAVFSMLALVYLTIATSEVHSHDKAHPEDLEPTPAV